MSKIAIYRLGALLLVITIVFSSLLCGCDSTDSEIQSKQCEYTSFGEDITDQVKTNEGDVLLLEDAGRRFVLGANGIFKVLDASGRILWSTGQTDEDAAAVDESMATANVNYFSDGGLTSKNTYTDSFKKEQHRYYRDGNTIICEQIIGDYMGSLLMPEALTEERFEAATSQMSQKDADYLGRQYMLYTAEDAPEEVLKAVPNIKNQPFYVLINSSGLARRNRIHAAFLSIGYTSEDILADRNAAGMTAVNNEVFKVVTRYRFENGDLIMEIPCNELFWPTSTPIVTIELMKYGAFALAGSAGSYIVSSGSGAQFEFTPNKEVYYSLQFDGPDYTTMAKNDSKETDYSGHPYFGLLRESVGNLAIVEEGAEIVRLRVENVPDGYVQYPELVLRNYQSTSLGGNNKMFYKFSEKAYDGTVRIRYCFFEDEEASYSNMAARYSEYLNKLGAFANKQTQEALPFEVEVVNTLYTTDEMLGVAYNAERVVTTFEETQNIVKWFGEQGINNIWLKLNGANKNGLFVQSPGRFTISKKAGGEQAYTDLVAYCKQAEIPFFLQVTMPFYFSDRQNDGYNPDQDTARQLNQSVVQLYLKERSNNLYRGDLSKFEVVSPNKYLSYAKAYVESADVLGNGVSVGELTRLLNSENKDGESVSRADAKKIVSESLAVLGGKYSVLGENPSAYTMPYLYAMEKMPLKSIQYRYFERDIPFVPLAVHGQVMYTSTYWNNQPRMQEAKLKAIEYGSGIAYRFAQNIGKEDVADQNSFLYNIDYELWKETALSNYQYVSEALAGLSNVKMKEHVYLSDTVVRVLYENGTVIYINYGNEAVSVDGVSVEANSYLRK